MSENGAGASPDRIRIERVGEGGRIADVRLVRGDKHNALDYAMFEALDASSEELAKSSDLRAVVISGDGPSFCSGLDFPSFAAEGRDLSEVMFGHADGDPANLAQRVTYNWLRMPAPVIAALTATASAAAASWRSARTSGSPGPICASRSWRSSTA